MGILQEEFKGKDSRKELADGWFVLALFTTTADSPDIETLVLAHIALQYYTPFRPTLVLLEHFPDTAVATKGELLRLLKGESQASGACVKLKLETKGGFPDVPALRTSLELCQSLAALAPEERWSCRVLELSKSRVPSLLPPACVKVVPRSRLHELWSPDEHLDRDHALHLFLGHNLPGHAERPMAHDADNDEEQWAELFQEDEDMNAALGEAFADPESVSSGSAQTSST